jgi:uncharacterized membrane protein
MDEQNKDQNNSQSAPAAAPAQAAAVHNKTLMGVLAYLGILVIIPFLMAKEDPFVKFHIKQGLLLFIIEIALNLLAGTVFMHMWQLVQVVQLGVFILAIMGIVNVVNNQQKELPLIGHYASYFTF